MGVCLACGGQEQCAECVRVLAAFVRSEGKTGRGVSVEGPGVEEPALPGLELPPAD